MAQVFFEAIAANPILTAWVAGAIALAFAAELTVWVMHRPAGTQKMQEVSAAVREGALAYLNRQYRTIAVFAAAIAIILAFAINVPTAVTFVAGAALSATAGYVGMMTATRANVRTTAAAQEGLGAALKVAFKGGAITGTAVVGFGIIGVVGAYQIFGPDPLSIVGFGFGASLISLFARVAGGIYTKAADVGADLVGKVEKGIPEDDPRNPAVIADNVGDNVGDDAGMAADLFETFAITLIGAMLLGFVTYANEMKYVTYPIILAALGIVSSVVGAFFVRLGKSKSIMRALYQGLLVTGVVAAAAFYAVTMVMFGNLALFGAALVGLVIAIALFAITEYYTSKPYSPVQSIARGAASGAGINIIQGLAIGMLATALPVIVISAGILVSYALVGVYGVAIAVMAMLSLTGMIITLDAFGPVTDNAGGIAEMTNQSAKVRKVTNSLDAVGNTTKAVTKSYAIGSAALAAITLFAAYVQEVKLPNEAFTLANPLVVTGLLIGGVIPFVFSSFAMRAVGKAAFSVVEEVRRQFRTIKGIMAGKAKPDYGKAVDIVTKAAIKEMAAPGILAVGAPLAVGFILGPLALGGLLLGSIVTGFLLAIHMTTSGGAWDNAKKWIEEGNLGGKGSDAHKAAVVGDTVGDPYKDTAGPAINPLIKVMNTIALIFAALIVQYAVFI